MFQQVLRDGARRLASWESMGKQRHKEAEFAA
jgi:hypothetical protein